MLRITPNESKQASSLRLEGKLCGPWVHETERCWQHTVRPDGSQLTVDLKDVSYVDEDGRELLLRMESQGAALVGASAFLLHLLRAPSQSFDSAEQVKSKHQSEAR